MGSWGWGGGHACWAYQGRLHPSCLAGGDLGHLHFPFCHPIPFACFLLLSPLRVCSTFTVNGHLFLHSASIDPLISPNLLCGSSSFPTLSLQGLGSPVPSLAAGMQRVPQVLLDSWLKLAQRKSRYMKVLNKVICLSCQASPWQDMKQKLLMVDILPSQGEDCQKMEPTIIVNT